MLASSAATTNPLRTISPVMASSTVGTGEILPRPRPHTTLGWCGVLTAMRNGFKVFDADAHVIYPADLWSRFLDTPSSRSRRPAGARRASTTTTR